MRYRKAEGFILKLMLCPLLLVRTAADWFERKGKRYDA